MLKKNEMVKGKYSCTFSHIETAIVTTSGDRSVTELNLDYQKQELRNIVLVESLVIVQWTHH